MGDVLRCSSHRADGRLIAHCNSSMARALGIPNVSRLGVTDCNIVVVCCHQLCNVGSKLARWKLSVIEP